MHWTPFFHIYQPPNQLPDILERIVFESYRAIIRRMREHPRARVTLNINGGLTEMLARNGYQDIIDGFAELARAGKLEFTESCQYHIFAPRLPESEIVRQIELNHRTNRRAFGDAYRPVGFFAPEMVSHPTVARIVDRMGYQWMLADEIAFNGHTGQADYSRVYRVAGTKHLRILFTDKRVSNLIAGAIVRSGRSLIRELGDARRRDRYLLTAMDGETAGHHRPGLDELLFDIFDSPAFDLLLASELVRAMPHGGDVRPVPSSWSTNEEDLQRNQPFKLWWQQDNPIHRLQWQFTNFAIHTVHALQKGSPDERRARPLLDMALHSDHYWWASKYWWSLEIVEQGAFNLRETVWSIRSASRATRAKVDDFYRRILDQAFVWQRTGYIRTFHTTREEWQSVPFKKRTHAEWFNQMILEFESEMRKAARHEEYEKAIKWRDAIIKLKSGADVYDVLHVVNELWTVRKIPSAKPFLQQKRFTSLAKRHFLPLDPTHPTDAP